MTLVQHGARGVVEFDRWAHPAVVRIRPLRLASRSVVRDAALFDWDGTLLDSREALLHAWHTATEAVTGRRYPTTAEEEALVFTLPGSVLFPPLTEDERQLAALVDGFQAAYLEASEDVRAFEGIGDALADLRAAGLAIGVVTSKGRRRFEPDARRAGLAELIDAAICQEDVAAPKPDPAPVLAACAALRVAPGRAVMTGDTAVDVDAGLRAGTAVVGVAWGAGDEQALLTAGAHAVVRHPDELARLLPRVETTEANAL